MLVGEGLAVLNVMLGLFYKILNYNIQMKIPMYTRKKNVEKHKQKKGLKNSLPKSFCKLWQLKTVKLISC